jgi:AcrR family transcriptional regulator
MTDTRQRILEAAERSMTRYGMAMSVRDIAAEAGVSRGSVYRYFGDRSRLVDAVLEHTADRFLAAMAERVDRAPTLADQVAEALAFVAVRGRQLAETAAAWRTGPAGRRETPMSALLLARTGLVAQGWLAFWVTRLEAAVARGELRPDVDARRAAEWLVRLLLSFAMLPQLMVDSGDRTALRRFVRDGLLRGIGA